MIHDAIGEVGATLRLKVEHMPGKLPPLNFDDIVQDYRSGMTAADIAGKLGIGTSSVIRILAGKKVSRRVGGYVPSVTPDRDTVLDLYDSGIGAHGIAKRLGCKSRGQVQRIIIDSGRSLRDRSAQQQARMDAATREQRLALTAAAHASVRGKAQDPALLIKRAMARTKLVGRDELVLSAMLANRGISTDQQTPVGPYNCDLTSGAVAVEVWGGNWHWHGRHIARCEKRFRYIMDRGWNILVVVVNRTSPMNESVADYVASYIQESDADPSSVREYRVIWRAGEDSTGGRSDDAHFSVEPPFGGRRNPTNGRYERVAR